MDYSTDKSEFNFAISYLNRLNMLFYQAIDACLSLNAYNWHSVLFVLYRELSTHMKPEDQKEIYEQLLNMVDDVQRQVQTNSTTGKIIMDKKLYKSLSDIEIKLRKILKDAGLETKLTEDARKTIR